MAAFNPLSLTPILDGASRPVVGVQLSVYDSGTLTPRVVYADGDLNVPLQQPLLTPASGRVPSFWFTGNRIRIRIIAPDGVLIDDLDELPGDVVASGGGGGGGGTSDFLTGDVLWAYRTGQRANFVRCNGRTIGSAVSGATELGDATTQPLFEFLWNATTLLAVSGGRGSTATADFLANKAIQLPDLRAGVPVGLDDMGNTALGRLAAAVFAMGNATSLGSQGGEGGHGLSVAELASHLHFGTVDSAGQHQHPGSTYGAGGHSHSGTTDSQGDHTHNVSSNNVGVGPGTGNAVSGIFPSGGSANTPTLNAGSHAHNLNIGGVGDHAHSYVTDPAGYHQHTFTSGSTGSGAAHNNMPPFVLGTWYMRL